MPSQDVYKLHSLGDVFDPVNEKWEAIRKLILLLFHVRDIKSFLQLRTYRILVSLITPHAYTDYDDSYDNSARL